MNLEIFNSPEVYEPSKGDLSSPVFRDGRGEIHRLEIGGTKLNMLFSKAGVLRSGDVHKNTQFGFVFSGLVRVWYWRDGQKSFVEYGPNAFIKIEPSVPHMYEYLEDTVNAEWWDGPFKAWFFRPLREIVEGKRRIDEI